MTVDRSLGWRRVVAALRERGVEDYVAERFASEAQTLFGRRGVDLDELDATQVAHGLIEGAIKQLGPDGATEIHYSS